MHVTYAAVLLLLLTEGCARVKPDTQVSEPAVVATQPGTPKPAAKPIAPATPQPAPAEAPAPSAKPVAAGAASKAAPPVAKATAVAPALDLTSLEERLRETEAIGFFTKITLKNQVDDLLDRFRDYYEGKSKLTMTDLRRSYELLMMKVLSLLQDEDQDLASGIVSSREAILGAARGSEEVRDPPRLNAGEPMNRLTVALAQSLVVVVFFAVPSIADDEGALARRRRFRCEAASLDMTRCRS